MCGGKFHFKNGVKNRKFHANFTLLGRSAEVMFLSKITELIVREFFHPVAHCSILFMEFRSEYHGISERQGVLGNGPE